MAADGNLGLGVRIDLEDGFSQKGKAIGLSMDSVASKAFKLNQVTDAVRNVTAALDQFVAPFVELDKQVKNIGTLGVENFEEFAGLTSELSKTVPDDAAKLAEGVYTAISAGIQGTNEEVLGFVETASKAAVAGGSTTQAAVDGLTSVMNAYKMETSEAAAVSDTFFAAIKLGKTTFPEMNRALANVVPTASALGVGFDEVSAGIAQMTALGVPTAQASTQLRQAMVELQKPGKQLAEVMAGVGLNAGNIKQAIKDDGLIGVLQKLEKEAKKSGLSMVQTFSSVEAGGAALLLTGENAESATKRLKDVRAEIEAGVSSEAYDVAAEGIGVKFAIMKNKVQAVFNSLFEAVGPGVVNSLQMLNQFGPAISALAPMATLASSALTALKASTLGVAVGEKIMAVASGFSITGLWGMATAAWAAVAPFLPFILAGAAVAAVIYLIYDNIEVLVEWFNIAVDWLMDLNGWFLILLGPIGAVIFAFKHMGTIIEWLSEGFNAAVDWLMDLSGWILFLLGPIGAMIFAFKHMGEVLDVLGSIWDGMVAWFSEAVDWLSSLTNWFYLLLGPIGLIAFALTNLGSITELVGGIFDNVVASIGEKFGELVTWFTSLPAMFFNIGQNMVLAIKDGLSAAWGSLTGFLMNGISQLPGGSMLLEFFGGGGGGVVTGGGNLGGGDVGGIGDAVAQGKAVASTPTIFDKSTNSTEVKEFAVSLNMDGEKMYEQILDKDKLEEGRS